MFNRLLLYILFTGILGTYTLNRLYEHFLRPDSLFFSQTIRTSEQWNKGLRKNSSPCYVFTGGSEVRMNIEPQAMLEKHGIQAVNAGVQAGCGVRCNTQIALPFLRKGDTLLISYIPGNNNLENNGMTHTGINFCHTMQGFSPYINGIIPVSYYSLASLFRGSSTNYAIHLMRLITRPDCIYRYSSPKNAEISKTGRVNVFLLNEQQVALNNEAVEFRQPDMQSWKLFLNDLRTYCQKHGIKIAMYISRGHSSAQLRKNHASAALYFMSLGYPVLKDPYLGCWPDASMYSDTALHLNAEGARIFSEFLAVQLKNQEYWSKEELQQFIDESITETAG